MSAEDVGFEIIEEIDREFHDSTDQVIAMVGAAYLDAPLDKLLRAVFIEKADDCSAFYAPMDQLDRRR
jgi:hypothetical protein